MKQAGRNTPFHNGRLSITAAARHAPERPTLLCIDDQATGLAARKAFLGASGYCVLTATGGGTGLEILRRHAVDGVILDYCMPGANGDVVAERIRRRYPRLAIIMLSGSAWEVPPATREIVDALLAKDDPPESLLATLAEVLRARPEPGKRLRGGPLAAKSCPVKPAARPRDATCGELSPKAKARPRGCRRALRRGGIALGASRS